MAVAQVAFPGAVYIRVSFSDDTCTGSIADYITFFKDDSFTSFWGKERYGGPRDAQVCTFPGPSAPLISGCAARITLQALRLTMCT